MLKSRTSVLGLLFAFVFVFALAYTMATNVQAGVSSCCEIWENGELVCKGHYGSPQDPFVGQCHTQPHNSSCPEHWCIDP